MRICVALPRPVGLTETFIRAHLERLPHEVLQLHSYGPDVSWQGQKLREWYNSRERSLSKSLINVLPRFAEFRLRRRFFPPPDDQEIVTGFLREQRIEVVLAEYGTMGSSITPACEAARIPIVVHFHGFDASQHSTIEEYKYSYQKMFACAHKVIVVSKAMHERVAALGCPTENLVISHYGPDPAFFKVKPDYKSNTIIAVGRLTGQKAPHLTILAFSKAIRKCPDLNLIMIGDGELRGVCLDLVAALGLKSRVSMLGACSHAEVRQLMERAFLFVQHSVEAEDGNCEGTPLAILEAGAAGLPIVSTKHAGIPDVVLDGKTGILVEERDVDGMSRAIAQLAGKRDAAATFGRRAQERVSKEFSMEKHIATIDGLLQRAASQASGLSSP